MKRRLVSLIMVGMLIISEMISLSPAYAGTILVDSAVETSGEDVFLDDMGGNDVGDTDADGVNDAALDSDDTASEEALDTEESTDTGLSEDVENDVESEEEQMADDENSVDSETFESTGQTGDGEDAAGQGEDSDSTAESDIQSITGFDFDAAPYDTYYCAIADKPSLDELLEEMPETMSVYLDGADEAVEIPVTWYCYGDDYEGTSYYYYQFRLQWDESEYQLSETLDVLEDTPYILLYMVADDGVSTASVTGKTAETTIYNYLVNTLGCNMATAVGILANIYKESGFSPTASVVDTNGKISYGICQWNGDRYTALKNYCGSSYNTVEGQLKYLKYELENSEKSAWSRMQGFANTAAGAYNAAYTWAQYFERCAHYYNGTDQYAARGVTARDTFWPSYYATVTSTVLTISGANAPSSFSEGNSFSIKGTISSGSKITSVTIGCYDSSGKMVIGTTVSPGSTSFNINSVDDDIKFGSLVAGNYLYKITAKNSAGTSKTLVSQWFTVAPINHLQKINGIWYYCTNGVIQTSYTGMARNEYGWWYVTKGKLDLTYTGMAWNGFGWWYMKNGKLDLTYTGLATNAYGTWYMKNGKLDKTYTGMYKYNGTWVYISSGKWNTTYTGMAKNAYGWWYIKNGKLDLTYTGIATNSYGSWYMKNGKLQSSYSGKVTLNGTTYTIKNGKVV